MNSADAFFSLLFLKKTFFECFMIHVLLENKCFIQEKNLLVDLYNDI